MRVFRLAQEADKDAISHLSGLLILTDDQVEICRPVSNKMSVPENIAYVNDEFSSVGQNDKVYMLVTIVVIIVKWHVSYARSL